jgi:hypothetical protein
VNLKPDYIPFLDLPVWIEGGAIAAGVYLNRVWIVALFSI